MAGATLVVNSIAVLSTLLLAKLLTPEDFGLVAIVVATTAIVASVSELSLSQALIRIENPSDSDYDTAWTLNLCRAIALTAIQIVLAFPIANAFGDQRLVPLFAVAAMGSAIGGLENPRIAIFRRKLDFHPDFQFQTANKFVAFLVSIAIAVYFRSYWALVLGGVAATAFHVVFTYVKLPHRPRINFSSWRTLLSFSIWLTLAQVTRTINKRGMPLLASGFLSIGALGQYSFGERIATIPIQQAGGAIKNILFPAFSRMSGDLGRMRQAYVRAQAVISLVALPIGFGIAAVAEPLVIFGLGEKWLASVPVIQAVAVATGFHAIQNAEPIAMATGKTKDLFLRSLRALSLRLPLALGGLILGQSTQLGELAGLALGLLVSAIANILLNMLLIRRLIGCSVWQQWTLAARPLASGAAMLGVVWFMQPWLAANQIEPASFIGLMVLISSGSAVFGGSILILVLAFGGPKSAEREVFRMARQAIARKL